MGVGDWFDEFEKDRNELLSKLTPTEIEVREIFESWFGEAIENMDNGDRVEKYLLKPIYKVLKRCQNADGVV